MNALPGLDVVQDHRKARLALAAPRSAILALARDPISASGIARRLAAPRQRVNYHVRVLARAGFLRRAGRRQCRGLKEQLWVATARAFLLAPAPVGPDAGALATPGAEHAGGPASLMLLAARLQQELGRACRDAGAAQVPVFGMDAELRFRSAAQRSAFANALTAALTRVIAEHAEPASPAGPTRGARFRLFLGTYPIPPSQDPDHV